MGLRMICKTCRTENQNVENGNLYEKKREVDSCNIQSKGSNTEETQNPFGQLLIFTLRFCSSASLFSCLPQLCNS